MSKQEITKVKPNPIAVAPKYMGDEATGTDDLKKFVTPPRVKIVQKQSDDELHKLFNIGDCILSPNNELIAAMTKGEESGESFLFTPLFFYAEWCTFNPISMRGKAPMIIQRSIDTNSPLAQKARNAETRYEQRGDIEVRHVECLNFIVLIQGQETPAVMTFQRASHGLGRTFCGLIRQRKSPIYGGVYEARVISQSNDQGQWCAIQVTNPPVTVSAWVGEDEFRKYAKLHEDFKELQSAAKLRTNYEEEETVDTSEGNF